jgi:hypothetical protein
MWIVDKLAWGNLIARITVSPAKCAQTIGSGVVYCGQISFKYKSHVCVCVCSLLGVRLRKLIKIRLACSPSIPLFSVDCHLEVHNLIEKLLRHL